MNLILKRFCLLLGLVTLGSCASREVVLVQKMLSEVREREGSV